MNIEQRIDALLDALEDVQPQGTDETLSVLISLIAKRVDEEELANMQKGCAV